MDMPIICDILIFPRCILQMSGICFMLASPKYSHSTKKINEIYFALFSLNRIFAVRIKFDLKWEN